MENRKQLIVVDDETEICRLVAKCAAPLGYEVTELADSRGFESALEKVRPDAVVIDMVMPHRDGFDLLEVVTHSDHDLKVILVTGHLPAYTQSAEAHLEILGFKDVWALTKPFCLAELRRALAPADTEAGHCYR